MQKGEFITVRHNELRDFTTNQLLEFVKMYKQNNS